MKPKLKFHKPLQCLLSQPGPVLFFFAKKSSVQQVLSMLNTFEIVVPNSSEVFSQPYEFRMQLLLKIIASV